MDLSVLIDPLFRVPLIVGLMAAVILPILGAFLRLREEWLAALGLAHLSAASGLAGLVFHLPMVVGAPIGAICGAIAKVFLGAKGNTAYAVMILVGWSATLLAAANTPLGESFSHAMIDGQLYFADLYHLIGFGLLFVVLFSALPWLMPRLIRARLFPYHEQANRLPAWHWHLSFDLMVAVGMAFGTATTGLMAAFALVFIPPWLAFHIAPGWRSTLLYSIALGVAAYMIAFVVAIVLDQPFGPVMVATLLMEVPIFYFIRARRS